MGGWLEMDDGRTEGLFIHLGGAGNRLQPFRFKMGDFPGATPFALSTFHSFSKDGKWYARITHSGEAFVWNLEGKQNPDTFHTKASPLWVMRAYHLPSLEKE